MEHPLRQACDCRWPRWATGGLKASLNLLWLLFAPISFQPLQEFLVVPAMRSLWPPPGWTTPSSLLWWGGASLSAQPCVGSILLKCLGRRGWAQPPGTAAPDLAPALAPSSEGCPSSRALMPSSCPEHRRSLQSALGLEGGPGEPFTGQTDCEGPCGPPTLTGPPGKEPGTPGQPGQGAPGVGSSTPLVCLALQRCLSIC